MNNANIVSTSSNSLEVAAFIVIRVVGIAEIDVDLLRVRLGAEAAPADLAACAGTCWGPSWTAS